MWTTHSSLDALFQCLTYPQRQQPVVTIENLGRYRWFKTTDAEQPQTKQAKSQVADV